ncbi:MAG: extracellular solute-binding protein [Vampirovibrionales bacterium]|nr:extracellular solute-binding protein [Vampirovibrionales bacterium]
MSLNGCGAAAPSRASAPITLELWTLQLMTFSDVIQPALDDFERAHPGVRVQWTDVPFNEGEKRAITGILGPNVPDVINLNPDFSAILAARGALVNMAQAVSAQQRAAFLPVAWQAVTLAPGNATTTDKRAAGEMTFAAPWYLTSRVTLYNRRLLEQAGWREPPRTMRDLIAFARQLRQRAPHAYAVMPNIAASGNFLKELQKNGIAPYDSHNRAVFAQEAGVALLRQWRALYAERLAPPESLTEGPQAAVDRYQSGALAMLMTGPNFLTTIRENAPAVYRDTAVAPQFPQDVAGQKTAMTDFATMALVVPKRSRHPQLAVELALWLTQARYQLALCDRAPVLPSVVAALQDARFRQEQSRDLATRARSVSAGQLLRARAAYQIRPQQKAINDIMDWRIQQALLGTMSEETAMAKAEDAINEALKGR